MCHQSHCCIEKLELVQLSGPIQYHMSTHNSRQVKSLALQRRLLWSHTLSERLEWVQFSNIQPLENQILSSSNALPIILLHWMTWAGSILKPYPMRFCDHNRITPLLFQKFLADVAIMSCEEFSSQCITNFLWAYAIIRQTDIGQTNQQFSFSLEPIVISNLGKCNS